ncbi:hypothetical protein ACFSUS_03180 [Spirosoma soli]|uniref:DUF2807 domain-containing protein n=1 Tax=Spirosoma soli TaxID=1770529 RepID=A0ABW5LXV7_9BACT
MKTSHILLAIIAVLTLTGMVATDILLKDQYRTIDWRNPYQQFEQKALPAARHWVIDAAPIYEIKVVRSTGQPKALVAPDEGKFFRVRQEGDTAFVTLTPDYDGYLNRPRDDANQELGTHLLLQLPDVRTIRVNDGRLTLSDYTADSLNVWLQNSRLRTNKLTIANSLKLTASQNSFAVLGRDHYKLLQVNVQDSSGLRLNNTQALAFRPEVSSKAEVQLREGALRWLSK